MQVEKKKETLTLSLPKGTKEKLDAIAKKLKIFWGKSPSPSGLITAIADGDFEVGKPYRFGLDSISALYQAINLLIDKGCLREAQNLYSLLFERGDLAPDLRVELLGKMAASGRWHSFVEGLIQKKQPFLVIAKGELHAQFAKISFRNGSFYLDIWAEDPGRKEIPPELKYNQSFPLNSIKLIIPYGNAWRDDGLDTLLVTFNLIGDAVFNYQKSDEDFDILDDVPGGISVMRRVSNLDCFFEEILTYGDKAEIIDPPSIRALFSQKIEACAFELFGRIDSRQ